MKVMLSLRTTYAVILFHLTGLKFKSVIYLKRHYEKAQFMFTIEKSEPSS